MARTTVKDEVFRLLCGRPGEPFSGEALADRLSVSRAAVWKAVRALREEGYPIEGTPNRGYALAADFDLLTAADVEAALTREAAEFYEPQLFSVIDSTNTALIAAGHRGAAEGTVFIAEEQTAGKGRLGRSFFSPKGSGVYISILLRPSIPAQDAILITTMAAVAGAQAAETVLRHFSPEPAPGVPDGAAGSGQGGTPPVQIKWVNDLFLNGRKFAGILTEADFNVETGGLSQAVLGIGFNLCPPEGGFPQEIAGVAGSLYAKKQPVGARALLAASFLNAFYSLYSRLPDRAFTEEYRARSLVLGRTVEVLRGTEVLYTARAVDVDDACNLLVIPDGETRTVALNSGEVRVRV